MLLFFYSLVYLVLNACSGAKVLEKGQKTWSLNEGTTWIRSVFGAGMHLADTLILLVCVVRMWWCLSRPTVYDVDWLLLKWAVPGGVTSLGSQGGPWRKDKLWAYWLTVWNCSVRCGWRGFFEFAITSSPAVVLQRFVLGFVRLQNTLQKKFGKTLDSC